MALEINVNKQNLTACPTIEFEDDEMDEENEVYGEFEVVPNPFSNCQSFSIAGGEELNRAGDDTETIRLILRSIIENAGLKPQGVFDIKDNQLAQFRQNIEPWANAIYHLPYVSTNGSNMNILVVQFNTKLILQ